MGTTHQFRNGQKNISSDFSDAAGDGKGVSFSYAFKKLKNDIRKLTRDDKNLNHHEPALKFLFKGFLNDIGATPALLNFDALLAEKSGDNFYRSNGDVSWYHEFLAMMPIMELAAKGKKKGGFDIADLDAVYGVKNGDSLVILLNSHERHDSVEDILNEVVKFNDEQKEILARAQQLNPDYTEERNASILKHTVNNVDLISQKRIKDDNGEIRKESTIRYNQRITSPVLSNAGVYMQKQADVSANFATMHSAPKFTPQKRLDRCNGCEDRYGRRIGFTNKAIRQWPEFKNALATLDDVIGIQLYTSVRYLESVDLHYKEPTDEPVDIDGYLRRAMSLNLPEAVHPVHCFIKDMMKSVDPGKDPQKHARLENFLTKVVMPPLRPYRDKFPYLFDGRELEPPKALPAPIAVP